MDETRSIFSAPEASSGPAGGKFAVDERGVDNHNGGTRMNWLDAIARRAVMQRLSAIEDGRITLRDAAGQTTLGRGGGATLPPAVITVHRPRFFRALALGGSLGAAEAYLRGDWSCDDLVSLVRIVCRNAVLAQRLEGPVARLFRNLAAWGHRLRRNTRRGSRRNIEAHYDLGNEFFATFLDPTLTYSCALFEAPSLGLDEAQLAKYDRLCRKLDLSPNDHLLEIGCGWGGFALHAAGNYGCRITATTISPSQYELACDRVRAAGLHDRVEVMQCDYRDLTGQYDKLVSIEMIEAVGHEYLDTYFAACARLLRPDGLMALQGITIADEFYAGYRRSADFIQRYVFPGGCVPAPAAVAASVGRATDLRLLHFEELGPHYARTLAEWRRRFLARREELLAKGQTERFLRLWEYYLCYCEGGFRERQIGLGQWLFARPGRELDLRPRDFGPATIPAVGSAY